MPTGVALRDVREQLFDAAERVLLRDRPDALTSRAVTTEAGVAKGVLHRHFADFDAFLAEFVLDRVERMDPQAAALRGRAGTGKSALALCAGLEAVMERRQHRKLVVFRPLYAVGGQELGYLPGSEADKMNPWAQAVYDTLSAVTSQDVIDEVLARDMFEVLPLTHIRGRSLHDSFVVVDEAQSLEQSVLLTVLSRIGSGSRVVLTHDIAQRDNLRVGRHDGVVAVIEKLKGHPLFAHVTLVRSERSPIAALVTEMLEDAVL
jgi:PhoH-like ATPase